VSLPVAILAGGLATRLGPLTASIPKSLVDVAGRPFAEHQIELLRRYGLTDITFLVGHFGEMIRDAMGDGARWGVTLQYVFDGPRPLGTGGAVRRALPSLADPFFVLYGDSYLECDYGGVERSFQAGSAAALMTVFRNENQWDASNVLFRDGRILSYDKQWRTPDMRHIDYGLGVFRHRAFDRFADGEAFDLVAVYQRALANDELAGYEVNGRFYEIGSSAGLEQARAHLSRR
jgi:NDP-sugar pyrophosphorylase family protein